MSRGTRTIEIYRYNPDVDQKPRMQTYKVELQDEDRMLLDVLIRLKTVDETISFRRSCREGICGSDGMNVNGKNGLACLQNLNDLPEQIVLSLALWPYVGLVLGAGTVLLLGASFFVTRLLFWVGYHRSPPLRGLGFAAGFYPTITLLVVALIVGFDDGRFALLSQ